jgi:hypothetical protein
MSQLLRARRLFAKRILLSVLIWAGVLQAQAVRRPDSTLIAGQVYAQAAGRVLYKWNTQRNWLSEAQVQDILLNDSLFELPFLEYDISEQKSFLDWHERDSLDKDTVWRRLAVTDSISKKVFLKASQWELEVLENSKLNLEASSNGLKKVALSLGSSPSGGFCADIIGKNEGVFHASDLLLRPGAGSRFCAEVYKDTLLAVSVYKGTVELSIQKQEHPPLLLQKGQAVTYRTGNAGTSNAGTGNAGTSNVGTGNILILDIVNLHQEYFDSQALTIFGERWKAGNETESGFLSSLTNFRTLLFLFTYGGLLVVGSIFND